MDSEISPEQKKLIDQYLDPDGVLEIPQDLLNMMTPLEIALADQLLASRFDIIRLLGGKVVTRSLAMRRAVYNITRLDLLLREARARRQ